MHMNQGISNVLWGRYHFEQYPWRWDIEISIVNFEKCWLDMKSRDQMNIFPTPPPVRICSYAIGTLCSPKVLVKYALLSEHLRFDARVSLQHNGHSMFLAPFHILPVSNQRCWELLMPGIMESRSWSADDKAAKPALFGVERGLVELLLNIWLTFISRFNTA